MAVRPQRPSHPSVGWGQILDRYFADEVIIRNHARSGRSTKSFIDEGFWARVEGELKPGHHLIIQFGRNDQKANRPDLHAEAHGAYRENLRRFVQAARDKGVKPILVTPLARRRFDQNARFRDDMGDYPLAVRQLAEQEQTPLLDLHLESLALLSSLGPEGSKALVWWIEPGTDPSLPEGKQDNSHLSEEGARQVCRIFAAELRRENNPLAQYLREPA